MPEDEQLGLPCHDKLSFDTEKDAKAAANVARYRYGNKLKVYICLDCGLWHLAST